MHDVIVLTSPVCHLCEDAVEALGDLTPEFDLTVRKVDMLSAEGKRLVDRYRPSMPPAVIVDGELFSAGRLPRKKLRRLLERNLQGVV